MRKATFLIILILMISLTGVIKADNIIPKLYLSAKNTPVGTTNWTITSAAINNAGTDYWKMLSGSTLETPTMNFSTFANIQVVLRLASFGTIASHSDDIKVEIYDGTTWAQVGSNLHTSSTTGDQTVLLPYTYTATKLRITAPNATSSVGARVFSVDITGTSTLVATTPVFNPGQGNVNATQTVVISTTTPSATIHYTVDGSEPTTSSAVYSTPVEVTSTTTIKAIATASGYDNSAVGSATYTFPTTVANLGALNSATHPGFYKVTGEAVLTLKSATRNAKYFQDNTGAVLIDDNSGVISTGMSIGDGVTGLIGTTSIYNGMLQFTPFDNSAIVVSNGTSVSPTTVTLANLANYPAQLVKVESVTISGTGNFASGTSYDLNSSSSTVLRTQYADLDYIVSPMAIPTSAQDITGVVLIYNSTAQIVPRSAADFVASLGTGYANAAMENGIYTSNGNVMVNASAGQKVEIYNSLGQRLKSVVATAGLNTISVNAKGVVLVKTAGLLTKVIL